MLFLSSSGAHVKFQRLQQLILQKVTSTHQLPQHTLTPLCDFPLPTTLWLSCCCPLNFIIIPQTADSGMFSNEEISWLNLLVVCSILVWYHTGIPWAPESYTFFHKCLLKQSACIVAWFYPPVSMEMIGTPEFNHFNDWIQVFWAIQWSHLSYVTLFAVMWQKKKKGFYIFMKVMWSVASILWPLQVICKKPCKYFQTLNNIPDNCLFDYQCLTR